LRRAAFGATGLETRRLVATLQRRAGDEERDSNGHGEVYVFGIDGDPTTLCYVLRVDKIQLVEPGMMSHIHEAPSGENGPIVVNLARPFDGDAADCLTEGEILPNGTPAFPTGETVAEILASPAAYYVNVHNPAHPGGAIRGQLHHD
jgi:hypothetical protein